MKPLELWGGHECSVNRIHERFPDQTVLSGHQHRLSDLKLFAGLGLTAIRYPVLWERVAPDQPDVLDFAWSDERMGEIRRLGMKPVVGLLHHGSGPRYTSLVDKAFPTKFAAYARAVAERYPWVDDWNPLNEPLTTARFSCLYGVWYPHLERHEGKFWLALLNEVDGVRLAMKEIRKVNPKARLIQTEDLGFSHATPPMAEEAEFENHRRWITWDLLAGRVTPDHPLWVTIATCGLHDRLKALADDPCPADVLGANYYVASERVLDHDLEGYPEALHGHDGPGDYINTDAVRSIDRGIIGLGGLLTQAWERYGTPISVTETHNVGTRDEMMRWILETWRTCEAVRRDGVEVEAVTAWTLLGAFDWKTLGVSDAKRYEVGVYDLGAGEPRPTAVCRLLHALAAGREPPANVALSGHGWWRREVRFEHDTEGRRPKRLKDLLPLPPLRIIPPPTLIDCAPILITGASGTLGAGLVRACERRALPFVATDRSRLRLEDLDSIRATLDEVRPSAVINAAGYSRIDGAEVQLHRCMDANALGPENLARACKLRDIPLITFSSDLVFDGTKGAPYVESDAPDPANAYGRSKAEGERRALAAGGRVLVVRTATLFSPYDADNFAVRLLNDLEDGAPVRQASDCFMSPTYVPDLADVVLDLLIDEETGVWHVTNPARMSWAEFGRTLAELAGFDPEAVQGLPAKQLGWRAPRPSDVCLTSVRGGLLSEALPAMERFLADTRLAARLKTPHPSADVRDPVLTAAAG